MNKKYKIKKPKHDRANNLVAKYCSKFNKPAVHRDRKNSYVRKPKHNKQIGE